MKKFVLVSTLIIFSFFSATIAEEDFSESLDKIFKSISDISSKLNLILSDPETWKDAIFLKDKSKTEKLIKYIDLSYTIRCKDIEKILVEHITYKPYKGMEDNKRRTFKQEYPVCNALISIGNESIVHLIKLLKTVDPDDVAIDENYFIKKDELVNKIGFALTCLERIYDKNGFGKEMTKYRLQLEIEDTKLTEKEKELLNKALQSHLLK